MRQASTVRRLPNGIYRMLSLIVKPPSKNAPHSISLINLAAEEKPAAHFPEKGKRK